MRTNPVQIVPLGVVHRDVGATIRTDVYLGREVLISYMPGTRYEDRAQRVFEEIMADALRPLLKAAAEGNGCHGIMNYSPDYEDDF